MKKLFLIILSWTLINNYSLAAEHVHNIDISCKGQITETDSIGGKAREIFFDDLRIRTFKNRIIKITIISTSDTLSRTKEWTENLNYKFDGKNIQFNQSSYTESEDFVEGFKGNLSLVSGMYSGNQNYKSTKPPLVSLYKNFVAQCRGLNKLLAKLSPESGNGSGTKTGSSGTAFLINNKGYLLTNHHVVKGCSVSKIVYKKKEYQTKLVAQDKTLDLALLKADLKNKSFINFSTSDVKKMEKIYVAGYPLGKGLSDDLKISSGIVSSIKGFKDNSNEIQVDAPINPGNSGGPIINEDGELVAIAVSGLSKAKTEGINFGIKASAAISFLKSNNLSPTKSFFSSSKDNDELLSILENSTVYTYCK